MTPQPFIGVRPPAWSGQDAADAFVRLLAWTEHAESLGLDFIYVGDRLLAAAHGPDEESVYEATMLDPFVVLSAMAARTQRVWLAPIVAVVPFRHPAYLAKSTATLDILSSGRLVLGAGSGWSEPELRMFGIDRRARGQRMEEAVQILRMLWSGEPIHHHGRFWQLEGIQVTPRPIQRPGPPIWFGSFAPDDVVDWSGEFAGGQRRSLERIGRIGDGWVPMTYSVGHRRKHAPSQLAKGWEVIRDTAIGESRDPARIEVVYAHWIAVARTAAERRDCEAALARWWPGSFEEATETYLIGTPEQIVREIRRQSAGLEQVDGYLFTTIVETNAQLELIAHELAPLLRE